MLHILVSDPFDPYVFVQFSKSNVYIIQWIERTYIHKPEATTIMDKDTSQIRSNVNGNMNAKRYTYLGWFYFMRLWE